MNTSTPITAVITTNCTIVESRADFHTISKIFDHFPNRFLPVVEGLRFVGVIVREEFLKKYMLTQDHMLTAADLISREIIHFSPHNTIQQAKQVFDTNVFDVVPVADEEGDLIGVLLRSEVEKAYQAALTLRRSARPGKLRQILSFLSL